MPKARSRTGLCGPAAVSPIPRYLVVALYVIVMVAVLVGVDVLLLRDHFWPRLFVNIAVVAAFAAMYSTLAKRA
jgi:hypothetical protein